MINIKNLEPGFYSSTTISPELTLSRPGFNFLALIGTASSYKLSTKEISGTGYVGLGTKYFRIKSLIKDAAYIDYKYAYLSDLDYTPSSNQTVFKVKLIKPSGTVLREFIINGNASKSEIEAYTLSDNEIKFKFVDDKFGFYVIDNNVIRVEVGDGSANDYLHVEEGGLNAIYLNNVVENAILSFYEFKNENDYKPLIRANISSFDDVKDLFLKVSDTPTPIETVDFSTSLAKGLYLAIQNGASNFIIKQIQLTDSMDNATKYAIFKNALQELESYYPDVIVPLIALNEIPQLAGDILSHVTKMSSTEYRAERIAVLGVDDYNYVLDIPTDWENITKSFDLPLYDSKRIVIVYPGHATMIDEYGDTHIINGSFIAAAFAGAMLSLEDEAETMTNKIVTGFQLDFPEPVNRLAKNALTALGVTVLEIYGTGTVRVRRAVSVNKNSIAEQEISITRTFDALANTLRSTLESIYVGVKIIPGETISKIEYSAKSILNDFVSRGLISKFNVSVSQDTAEPRKINIKLQASPVYPLIWGMINITITI